MSLITFTEKAEKEVKRLQGLEVDKGALVRASEGQTASADLAASGNQAASTITGDKSMPALRIKIVGGGCSGMSYDLGFETVEAKPNDKVIDMNGVTVRVDSKSALYIIGMELDFSDGLNGKGFVFNNPNAKRSCGCGSSFSV